MSGFSPLHFLVGRCLDRAVVYLKSACDSCPFFLALMYVSQILRVLCGSDPPVSGIKDSVAYSISYIFSHYHMGRAYFVLFFFVHSFLWKLRGCREIVLKAFVYSSRASRILFLRQTALDIGIAHKPHLISV